LPVGSQRNRDESPFKGCTVPRYPAADSLHSAPLHGLASGSWKDTSSQESEVSAPPAKCFSCPDLPTTSSSKRHLAGATEPAKVLGIGAGGIVELSQSVSDKSVAWALLRFQVGSGTFMRTKHVTIHCNGESTPVMLRGWLNARSSEVLSMMGDVHATIVVQQPIELTVENLCQRLLPYLAADHMDVSLAALKEEYAKMVARMEKEAKDKAVQPVAEAPPPAPPPKKPRVLLSACQRLLPYFAADHMDVSLAALNEEYAKMVARMEKEAEDKAVQPVAPPPAPPPKKPRVLLSATEALLAVGSENGCCNWLLLEPKALNLHGAGVGGLEEMQTHLAEDKVLFGILRLSFGGAFGLTKHVFVHWIGPRVGIVQRGLLNAKLASASALVNIHCSITFRREAHCLRDLDLENIISELRRLTVVDGVQGAARWWTEFKVPRAESRCRNICQLWKKRFDMLSRKLPSRRLR